MYHSVSHKSLFVNSFRKKIRDISYIYLLYIAKYYGAEYYGKNTLPQNLPAAG